MTSVFSWQNSVSLCPDSFCTPRPNLPATPGVSWLPTFAFQSPIMKRTSFLGAHPPGIALNKQAFLTWVSCRETCCRLLQALNMFFCVIQQDLVVYLIHFLKRWLWVVTFLPRRYETFSVSGKISLLRPKLSCSQSPSASGHTLLALIPPTPSSPPLSFSLQNPFMCAISSASFCPSPAACPLDTFLLSHA